MDLKEVSIRFGTKVVAALPLKISVKSEELLRRFVAEQFEEFVCNDPFVSMYCTDCETVKEIKRKYEY